MKNKKKAPQPIRALMIRPASLPVEMKALIQIATPEEFICKRPGKGKKEFTYVEGGYVIARLNQIFSPVGWDFEVTEHIIEVKEVIVKGKLTIKDHKNGYVVSKTQYGTHPRYAETPLGDSLKAAATDCLKKCASLLGIALDVYWQQLDIDSVSAPSKPTAPQNSPQAAAPVTIKKANLLKFSLDKIKAEEDWSVLVQYKQKIGYSDLYSDAQKKTLYSEIDKKLQKYGDQVIQPNN